MLVFSNVDFDRNNAGMRTVVLLLGMLAVAAEAFVLISSSRSVWPLVTRTALHAYRPGPGQRHPDRNLIAFEYRNTDDRAAAERTRTAVELARQAALADQERHYRRLKQRFVDALKPDFFDLIDKDGTGSVDFLEFCKGFGSELKGVGAVSIDVVGTRLLGRGEVTVADLRRLYDDLDTDHTGRMTADVMFATAAVWKSLVWSAAIGQRPDMAFLRSEIGENAASPQATPIGRRPDKRYVQARMDQNAASSRVQLQQRIAYIIWLRKSKKWNPGCICTARVESDCKCR